MITLHGTIESGGALVDTTIGLAGSVVQILRQTNQPVPAPMSLRALLDPGAEATCVDPLVLAPLLQFGIVRSRTILTNAPALGGSTVTNEYTVGLTIIHSSGNPRAHLVLRNQPVIELSLGVLGYQALIGRDILERCLFINDGPGKAFTLVY